MMTKRNIFVILGIAAFLLFSGCMSDTNYLEENNVLLFDGVEYNEIDENGRNVAAAWNIPEEAKTHEISVYYGSDNANSKRDNTSAELYDDPDLEMFILFAPPGIEKKLFCKTSYDLPDYRDGASIEAIKIYNNNTTIIIEEDGEVGLFAKALREAADDKNDSSEISEDLKDYLIEIKYSNCGAWYSFGRLVKDLRGEMSLDCYDANTVKVYTLGKEEIGLLSSKGISL